MGVNSGTVTRTELGTVIGRHKKRKIIYSTPARAESQIVSITRKYASECGFQAHRSGQMRVGKRSERFYESVDEVRDRRLSVPSEARRQWLNSIQVKNSLVYSLE
ncbi:hypothetical protein EVAR_57590_1 [Eumeta japonica]|uniref:Uncharacterized protein n=1 Tax=Eumeta variegata TaxID=151549 RepID=A0A4C1XZX0_EUMVA|nr:hypothetical protein EVAR_57590_1 [Eumeta japonica]